MSGFTINTGTHLFKIRDHEKVSIEAAPTSVPFISVNKNENPRRIKIFEKFLSKMRYDSDNFVYGITAPSCRLGCNMCFQNLNIHDCDAYSDVATSNLSKIKHDLQLLKDAGKSISISIYNNEFFQKTHIKWQQQLLDFCDSLGDTVVSFRIHTAFKDIENVDEYPFYQYAKNMSKNKRPITFVLAAKMNPDNTQSNHYFINDSDLLRKLKTLGTEFSGSIQMNLLCDPTGDIFTDEDIEPTFKLLSEIDADCEISSIFRDKDYNEEDIKFDLIFQFMRMADKYYVFVKGRECEVYSMYNHLVPINVTGPPMCDTVDEDGKIMHHYSSTRFPFTTVEDVKNLESKLIQLEQPKIINGKMKLEKPECLSCPLIGACSKGYCSTFYCNNELFTVLSCFAVKCAMTTSLKNKYKMFNIDELFDSITLSNANLNMYEDNITYDNL